MRKRLLIIFDEFRRQKRILFTVLSLAAAYVIISALLIFNVEPDSFENFFDAVYWATVSLTTVGYGDIYLVSTVGRAVAMASSIFGIAIIALPSGIVTACYLDEIRRQQRGAGEGRRKKCSPKTLSICLQKDGFVYMPVIHELRERSFVL